MPTIHISTKQWSPCEFLYNRRKFELICWNELRFFFVLQLQSHSHFLPMSSPSPVGWSLNRSLPGQSILDQSNKHLIILHGSGLVTSSRDMVPLLLISPVSLANYILKTTLSSQSVSQSTRRCDRKSQQQRLPRAAFTDEHQLKTQPR